MILTKWILEELDEKVDLINEKLKNKNDENVTTFRTNELEPTVKSVDNLIQTIKSIRTRLLQTSIGHQSLTLFLKTLKSKKL